MKSKGISIRDNKSIGEITTLDFSLNDVLKLIKHAEELNWAILELEVTGGDLEKEKWAQLRQFETSEEKVTRIDWRDLCETSEKFWQIVWITIIGCEDPKLVKSYQNDFEMYEACDIVIEVVDGGAFEVFSHNHSLIKHIRETFKDTVLLEPDRKDL